MSNVFFCDGSQIYLHELLIVIIEGLSIFSVVKSGHANYLLFFVDDWQRENILYGPAAVVERLRLQQKHVNAVRTPFSGGSLASGLVASEVSHLKLERLIRSGVHYVTDLRYRHIDGGEITSTY